MILDQRFPDRISFGATGGPEFQTDIVMVASGQEFRNGNRALALRRYDVAHAARREDLGHELLAFFHVARGRLYPFRFKDWVDYQCASGDGGFEDIGGGSYRFVKRYVAGADQYERRIPMVIADTLTIVGNAGGTIDADTGILSGGSGTPTGWSGEFDVLCRFDVDRMEQLTITRSKSHGLILGWQSIPLVEVLS